MISQLGKPKHSRMRGCAFVPSPGIQNQHPACWVPLHLKAQVSSSNKYIRLAAVSPRLLPIDINFQGNGTSWLFLERQCRISQPGKLLVHQHILILPTFHSGHLRVEELWLMKKISAVGLGSPLYILCLSSFLEAKKQPSTVELLQYQNLGVCVTYLLSTISVQPTETETSPKIISKLNNPRENCFLQCLQTEPQETNQVT